MWPAEGMDYKILEYDVQLYFNISPNSHYIIAHKLVYGGHCYAHGTYYLPQTMSV